MTVKQKQLLLAWFGYLTPKEVDEIWGPQSEHATECLQEDLDLVPDGVWGDQTDAAVREFIYAGEDLPEQPEPETNNPELAERFRGIRYWGPEEFRCQCGGKHCDGFPALPDRVLLELVDDLRHRFGRPGHRSSGLRCETHNRNEGGVWNSKHRFGKALDFFIEGVSGAELLAAAKKDPRTSYAYIISGQYVHVDVA